MVQLGTTLTLVFSKYILKLVSLNLKVSRVPEHSDCGFAPNESPVAAHSNLLIKYTNSDFVQIR
jgi:hypothetical protein